MTPADGPSPVAVAGAEDAARAIESLGTIMDSLIKTVEEETARVRAGRLRDAIVLGETKADLARRYALACARMEAVNEIVARALPDALAGLRQRHAGFQALLQTNLTVLATAHAVSEGILRGVSGELARKQAPSTYSASGRANKPNPKTSPPLSVSRIL